MMLEAQTGIQVDDELLRNYFTSLVNHFFKILPMREEGLDTLPVYARSLQLELYGVSSFIPSMKNDANMLRLLAVLQFLIDNPECDVDEVRREVFKAIRVCGSLQRKYRNK